MLSKDERQARLKILIKVEKSVQDGLIGLQAYEEAFHRDGIIISVVELLRGAYESLSGSITLLGGNELPSEGTVPQQRVRLRAIRVDEDFDDVPGIVR